MPWPGPTNTYASDEDPSTGWLFSISNGFRQGSGGLNPAADDFPAEGITPSGKGRATDYTPHKDIPGNNSTKGGPSRHSQAQERPHEFPPTPEQGEDMGYYCLNAWGLWEMVALHFPQKAVGFGLP